MRPILATATSYQGHEPLTNDVMRRYAPSIFAESAHTSRSDKYAYIPTVEMIEGLRKEGFQPFFVAQSRTRHEDRREYTKHMLRLRHTSTIPSAEAQEVVLINSHDGTSAYQMTAGVLRFVCMNGLILGDNIESIKVPHKGDVKDQVIEGAYEVVKSFTSVGKHMSEMKETNANARDGGSLCRSRFDAPLRHRAESRAHHRQPSVTAAPRRRHQAGSVDHSQPCARKLGPRWIIGNCPRRTTRPDACRHRH